MELREEAWSPGPLDSEDQQMASHENPGEMALGSPLLTLCPPLAPFASPPMALGLPILPPEALVTASLSLALASLPPGLGSLQVSFQLHVPGGPRGQLVEGAPAPCVSWSTSCSQHPGQRPCPILGGLLILPGRKLFRPGVANTSRLGCTGV